MIAASNTKPPRPFTEYNIFFQLERAYILQILFQAEPTIDYATGVFQPSQASYIGLPALPRRYASLVLPDDWHIPGKERRRKRKHRKTHGAIGFHELSIRIAKAWKAVDVEVKAYCSKVSAVGLSRHKAAVEEWKRNGGQQQVAQQKKRHKVEAKVVSHDASVENPEDVKSITNYKMKNDDFKLRLQNLAHNEVPISTPVISREVTSGETSEVFGNEIFLIGEEEVHDVWDIQVEPLPPELSFYVSASDILPLNAVSLHIQEDSMVVNSQAEDKVLRNASLFLVDMSDNEIISLWNSAGDTVSNHKYCCECTSAVPIANAFNDHSMNKSKTDRFDSMFGLKGYAQTMQEIQRMKLILEEQAAQLQKAKRPVMCHSIMACSA